MSTYILRLSEVKKRTGLSRSTIYARISANTFPKPIQLGARTVGWIDSEINAWIDQQIELSRNGEPSNE